MFSGKHHRHHLREERDQDVSLTVPPFTISSPTHSRQHKMNTAQSDQDDGHNVLPTVVRTDASSTMQSFADSGHGTTSSSMFTSLPSMRLPPHISSDPHYLSHNKLRPRQEYTSEPVSEEVAVNVAMYLTHNEQARSNDVKREELRHHHRSVIGTPKILYPSTLERQHPKSTSEVNAKELTKSSNEDSSTDAEVLTEPEEPRSRTDLPLGKIPQDLLASDSKLAVTPPGPSHGPSPKRMLASSTTTHLKPSAPHYPQDNTQAMHLNITLPHITSQQTDL